MGNSASVTPNGTSLAVTRPDIDVELCPPGTMAAMVAILDRYVTLANSGGAGNWNPEEEPQVIACRVILAAHRAKPQEPVVKQSLTTAKPDYTSETEDLSTWPQTRGPEWRKMGQLERLQKGDVRQTRSGMGYTYSRNTIGCLVGLMYSKEAWTRRPAPEAQP